MAIKADIREKFGLDYLTGPSSESTSSSAAVAETSDAEEMIDKAAVAFGRLLLVLVKESAESGQDSLTLNQLVDKMNVERDTLSLVIDRLEKLGLVRVERERYGNHTVRLTATGESFLKF